MRKNKESNSKQCKVIKNKNFTTMSNIHLRAKCLSLKAMGLLSLCLSLPEDWNYSIAGLVTLSQSGRDAVMSALNELQKYNFLTIEKRRTKKGEFSTYYTFYENPKENPHFKTQKTEKQTISDFHRYGFSDTENPQQLNTNKEILKLNTNNQRSFVKTDESVFTSEDLFNLFKEICIHFSQPRELTQERKKKALKRLLKYPKKEFWETVCKNAEKSLFARKTKFFTFDWMLKNDENPLKVYEGNYNQQEIKEETALSDNGGKYAKCYG